MRPSFLSTYIQFGGYVENGPYPHHLPHTFMMIMVICSDSLVRKVPQGSSKTVQYKCLELFRKGLRTPIISILVQVYTEFIFLPFCTNIIYTHVIFKVNEPFVYLTYLYVCKLASAKSLNSSSQMQFSVCLMFYTLILKKRQKPDVGCCCLLIRPM